jgi:tripartite-type tricarboxylate transporter receptor subunit TctC
MAEAQKDGEVRSQLEKLGYTLRSLSVEETRGFLKEESGRWERYVRELQIETQ